MRVVILSAAKDLLFLLKCSALFTPSFEGPPPFLGFCLAVFHGTRRARHRTLMPIARKDLVFVHIERRLFLAGH